MINRQAGETTQNLDPLLCSSSTVHAYRSIHSIQKCTGWWLFPLYLALLLLLLLLLPQKSL